MSTLTASGTATLKSINPATGEVVGEVPVATEAEIEAVVARARAAQPAWAALGLEKRAERVAELGAKLVSHADELGLLLTQEMGKPLAEGVGEAKHCGEKLGETLSEIVEALQPEVVQDDTVISTIHHDPFGVSPR